MPQQFGGVSPCHSRILKTEEEFLLNHYPFFQRCVVQAWCHPLIIVSENSFKTEDVFSISVLLDFNGKLSFNTENKSIELWLRFSVLKGTYTAWESSKNETPLLIDCIVPIDFFSE